MTVRKLGLVLLVLVVLVGAAVACPACKDQKPLQTLADGRVLVDPQATASAFNLSIYFMLSMIYGVPLLLGLVLWRVIQGQQARRVMMRAAREEAGS